MANKIVRKITKVGTEFVHIFDDGHEGKKAVTCSKKEYDDLGIKDAKPPKFENLKWLYSMERATFDGGELQKDDAQILEDGSVFVLTTADAYDPKTLIYLDKVEYDPKIVGNILTTSKEVPTTPNAVQKVGK
jgi:hypothetical protein